MDLRRPYEIWIVATDGPMLSGALDLNSIAPVTVNLNSVEERPTVKRVADAIIEAATIENPGVVMFKCPRGDLLRERPILAANSAGVKVG